MKKRERLMRLSIISPNGRYVCDSEAIDTLCDSIERGGQEEPITIWFTGSGFRILDGEKRWRACKRLGMTRIRVRLT
jgi:ParB family transcriptional regulator, chromosome partitioning protein